MRRVSWASMTVPMRYVRGMVDAAAVRGVRRDEVLAWAGGINPEMLDASRSRVSLKQFSRLYSAVALHLEDEAAGLSAYGVPLGAAETMIRSGVTATSLADGVEILAKALNAVLPGIKVESFISQDELGIAMSEIRPSTTDRHSTFEVCLLTTYAAMAWLYGRRLPLLSVDFPNAAPRHLYELRTLFAGTLRFNQPCASLRFSNEHASLPVLRTPAEVTKFLRRAPRSLIEALLTRGELAVLVRSSIHEHLPKLISLNEVAERFALSPRSLHRKLEAEGESFQKIKDDLRRDLSIYALTRTSQPLKQIAIDVGFSDQTSFQRAFVEWTGRPPGEWRRMASSHK